MIYILEWKDRFGKTGRWPADFTDKEGAARFLNHLNSNALTRIWTMRPEFGR
jgi:hypothetical protein